MAEVDTHSIPSEIMKEYRDNQDAIAELTEGIPGFVAGAEKNIPGYASGAAVLSATVVLLRDRQKKLLDDYPNLAE